MMDDLRGKDKAALRELCLALLNAGISKETLEQVAPTLGRYRRCVLEIAEEIARGTVGRLVSLRREGV